jgi:hypothetical protein
VRSLRSGLGVCAAADAAGLGSGAFQWWKMRPSGTAGDTTKQKVTVEQVADGVKVTTNIDFGNGTGMSRRTSLS